MTPYTSAILAKDVQKILETRTEEVEAGVKEYAAKVDVSAMPIDKQRAQQALKLALIDKVKASKSDGVALECWTVLGQAIGVGGCQVIGMLADLGIPCACESDVLGAVSAVMLQAATLGREPIFFADITVRHANDDNTELFWHCGPFPVSLAHPGSKPAIAEGGQGQFELRNGDVTICRMDALEGKYTLVSAEVSMIPQNTTDPAGDDLERLQKILDMLDDLDDVQDVYHNGDLPEEEDEDE